MSFRTPGVQNLVQAFAAEPANRYGVVVDFSIHAPHREGDKRVSDSSSEDYAIMAVQHRRTRRAISVPTNRENENKDTGHVSLWILEFPWIPMEGDEECDG